MELFEHENYLMISNFVEKKLPILKQNQDFTQKQTKLSSIMDQLENTLSEEQKEQFHEIVQLFYQTEEYYFALAYSLGVKYGQDLTKL